MAASTTASLPKYAHDAGLEHSALLTNDLALDFIPAAEWDVAAGDWGGSSTMSAIGGGTACKYLIWAGGAEDDALDTLWTVPLNMDRTKPIYAQVVFTGSATGSKSCTWTLTYNPLAIADDADTAPATALDETIPAKAAEDVDVLAETYVGKINANSIDNNEEFLMLRATISGGDSVTDWGFVGLKVYYHKAFA
jgi:hypothetical protein